MWISIKCITFADENQLNLSMRLYTIGHSSHQLTDFLNMLLKHSIDCIVDIRSIPASRYSPQFNKETLQGFLRSHNVDYQFFGYEFGARRNDSFNDSGYVDFELTVQTVLFQEGVNKLIQLLDKRNIALMCSEADPLECHRFSLIGKYFYEEGVEVCHILKDATISGHKKLEQEMISKYLHSRRPLLPNIDELFGTYTAEDQRRDAYRLKNKEIGFRIDQQDNSIY